MRNILPPFPEGPWPDLEFSVKGVVGVVGVLLFPGLELDFSCLEVHAFSGFFAVLEAAVLVLVAVVGQ